MQAYNSYSTNLGLDKYLSHLETQRIVSTMVS